MKQKVAGQGNSGTNNSSTGVKATIFLKESQTMLGQRRLAWLVVIGLLSPALAARAAEADQYFPNDTQAVVTINIKQILGAAAVKPNLAKLQTAMKGVDGLQKTLEDLGFDPMKDLDSVTVAAVGAEDPENALIIVRGKFDAAKFKAAADVEAKKEKGLKAIKAGDYTLYEVDAQGQPQPAYVGLVDGSTIVASPRKEGVVGAFDVKAGKKKTTMKPALQTLLAKNDAKQSISIAALGSALGSMVPFGDKVETIHGGINLADDIKTDIVILTKDDDAAKGLSALIGEGLEQGKNIAQFLGQSNKLLTLPAEILNNLKVAEKGKTVNIKGEVSKETIEKLKKDL
jgi:hypothetical protein